MDSFIEEEIKRNYNQAYVLISLFLAAIDTIFLYCYNNAF